MNRWPWGRVRAFKAIRATWTYPDVHERGRTECDVSGATLDAAKDRIFHVMWEVEIS